MWKADGTAKHGGFSAMQGPFGRGIPFPSRIKFTDRAYPVYLAGTLQRLSYSSDHATFDLRAQSESVRPGDTTRATLFYVPAGSRGTIDASGARLNVVHILGGARLVYAYPRGGSYHVFERQSPAQPPRRHRTPAGHRKQPHRSHRDREEH